MNNNKSREKGRDARKDNDEKRRKMGEEKEVMGQVARRGHTYDKLERVLDYTEGKVKERIEKRVGWNRVDWEWSEDRSKQNSTGHCSREQCGLVQDRTGRGTPVQYSTVQHREKESISM